MQDKEKKIKVIVLGGPTGSGKSDLAVKLAEEIGGEIVNADSMQVYRRLDIGTAKPSAADLARVPHHLIDILDPNEDFTASDFRREATAAIADIERRGKRAIVVGGTGLYIRALLYGLVDSPTGDPELRRQFDDVPGEELLRRLSLVDPETAARLHPNDRVRLIRALEVYTQTGRPVSAFRSEHAFSDVHYQVLKMAIRVERQELYRRIDLRVEKMLEDGLVEEVRLLLAAGYGHELKALRSIGYKEITAYLAGEMTLDEAVTLIKRDTRRYAKRQMTWFGKENDIYWLEYPGSFATILGHVIEFLA
ncbi:tRNA (N6-dimethylallyl-A37)-dimethylallyltransferase [Citrifermentans bemidjiense Bem]|uniref:tRNA dimethylallyltransferase 1 n=1 Tax=Citrifermentans bemidjiense (strain ATCC BAA-1014 / DSM 16622 / JCM 12645 / Bem) TaxID=404380 RepID=MIAA1_CITBB|nr:tRNA (adenosine(37)-N6)-dimethylallyltransferase MiaA [Citrifermentans bemidjiense]B5EGD5.1 RecName: Full=tRNA dimethylallyltransferase 1; AltName: Full=Dimethylallyl diphosphate:tRNA dimethylallyltransferase 1; Short=DMAPP:tRNA dimethylallyltransferase 1; Short=DMATase 1; AltName: Full=Isopentenyl-diphosphate:tRNA isopentenyltransferase 1; Short=IPP transferase 1; Short=IPPT 1; Short=IPTase 1 [Citrifermentans bemidjiense Bem]ACH38000.1 tRNA (N6-dimethylallyl-A37)-dimethylallyltransferase [Cit